MSRFSAAVVHAVQWVVWRSCGYSGRQEESGEVVEPHEEIRGTVEVHHQEGNVERGCRDVCRMLDLRELQIADVLVHRKAIVAVNADLPTTELFEALIEADHTAFPYGAARRKTSSACYAPMTWCANTLSGVDNSAISTSSH